MVVVKGGGQPYTIGNGRQVSWEEVPEKFKEKLREQTEIEKCVGMRAEAQACIEDRGFWDPKCVELTERFHMCQSVELSHDIKRPEGAKTAGGAAAAAAV
ncbi:transporter [Trypanosoma grayi]|uniref:transporter n=1 Tax=Trypanosoma grayi TaxID=71804 RepID=UPI0004F42430|nr:transporter [Trypanosoma grayi]KEG05362.1 transporter [Trypanosoma grayi]